MLAAVASYGASLLSGFTENKRDPVRLQENTQAYGLAASGNFEALKYLKHRSGKFGSAQIGALGIPETPGLIGGWATEVARNDAYAKYSALTGGTLVTPTPNAPSPLQGELQALGSNLRTIADGALADARDATATTVQRVGSGATMAASDAIASSDTKGRLSIPTDTTTLFLIGAGLVLALVILRK